MGNLCGKESTNENNFSTPGRTVSSAPTPGPRTASVPQSKKQPPKVGGPARTLGGGASESTTQTPEEARRKAAEAAEARASAKSGKGGKLTASLAAQKRQTRVDTLQEASAQNVQQRETDSQSAVRRYD